MFGEIIDDRIVLNDSGKMNENEWMVLVNRFPNIQLHEFIVMPNHFHAIFEIKGTTDLIGQTDISNQNYKTVGKILAVFKSISTVKYIDGVKNLGWQHFDDKLWQRNYWDSVIKDSISHQLIADYITDNPLKWMYDKLNPENM
jgi:REP element-mobilizing transposase RayT